MPTSTPTPPLGRPYALLLTGQSMATLGASTNAIGLVLLMLQADNPVRGLGSVQLMLMVPWIVLGPLAGAVADRWPKQRTLIACDVSRALLALALLWAHQHRPSLLLLVLSSTCLQVLFSPSLRAFMPELVPPGALPRAVSTYEFTNSAVRILGALLGGALSSGFGFTGVCVANAAAFALSAVLMVPIRPPAAPTRAGGSAEQERLLVSLRGGMQYLIDHSQIRFVVGFFAVATAFFAAVPVLLPVVVRCSLGLDDAGYGLLVSVDGIGALVGAALAGRLGGLANRLRLMTAGVGLWGLAMLLLVASPSGIAVALVLYFVVGCVSATIDILYEVFLQVTADPAYLGRVFSLDMAISNATALAAILAVTLLVDPDASQLAATVLCSVVVGLGAVGAVAARGHADGGRS